jgi:hypothetical protein
MVKLNYAELKFDHIVEFTKDNTIFAAARYNGNNHLRIFLIYRDTDNIYTRNGRADSWEHLDPNDAYIVRNQIAEARANNIPVYRVNASHAN